MSVTGKKEDVQNVNHEMCMFTVEVEECVQCAFIIVQKKNVTH